MLCTHTKIDDSTCSLNYKIMITLPPGITKINIIQTAIKIKRPITSQMETKFWPQVRPYACFYKDECTIVRIAWTPSNSYQLSEENLHRYITAKTFRWNISQTAMDRSECRNVRNNSWYIKINAMVLCPCLIQHSTLNIGRPCERVDESLIIWLTPNQLEYVVK